jgi:hypothetical protein
MMLQRNRRIELSPFRPLPRFIREQWCRVAPNWQRWHGGSANRQCRVNPDYVASMIRSDEPAACRSAAESIE